MWFPLGSLGIEIGHPLAASLGYQFAERDIISKAADRFGADVARLSHAVEERPPLVDRLNPAQRRFAQYVDATVQEMAARDDIVLESASGPGLAIHHLKPTAMAKPDRFDSATYHCKT